MMTAGLTVPMVMHSMPGSDTRPTVTNPSMLWFAKDSWQSRALPRMTDASTLRYFSKNALMLLQAFSVV